MRLKGSASGAAGPRDGPSARVRSDGVVAVRVAPFSERIIAKRMMKARLLKKPIEKKRPTKIRIWIKDN